VTALLGLLIVLVFGLASFGFALFVLESPYTEPIVHWFEQRKNQNWFYRICSKGLSCPLCSGFWGGVLSWFCLKNTLFGSHPTILDTFVLGCLGGATSLCLYYLREIAFKWLGGEQGKEQEDEDSKERG
jgi:hypothetical protein